MRIVLDTNVLVSALLNPDGVPAKVLSLLLEGRVTLYLDQRIFLEYEEVLQRKKFGFANILITEVLDFIRHEGEFVNALPANLSFKDKSDLKFAEVFLTSDADFLITGNLGDFRPLQAKGVVSPAEFLQKYLKTEGN